MAPWRVGWISTQTQLTEVSKHSVICPTRSGDATAWLRDVGNPPPKKHQIALYRQVEEYKLRDVSSQCDDE